MKLQVVYKVGDIPLSSPLYTEEYEVQLFDVLSKYSRLYATDLNATDLKIYYTDEKSKELLAEADYDDIIDCIEKRNTKDLQKTIFCKHKGQWKKLPD